MKIRFDHPATARLDFKPGDEIAVRAITPELEALLRATRIDGAAVAHIVEDDPDEVTAIDTDAQEAAVLRRGKARGQRTESLSR